MTRIAWVAGEASGDLLAGRVMPAVRHRIADAQFAGIGGAQMRAAGLDAWWPVEALSVRGYVEVLRHLPRLLWLRRSLVGRLVRWPAELFIGVDAPDFNLGVAARLKLAQVRTMQYVAPAVWAWRPERLQTIARAVDRVLTVFPFEAPLFERAGVRATYVGHPLAAAIPSSPDARSARVRLGVPGEVPVLALLPGSRAAEIGALAAPFLGAASILQQADAGLHVLLPVAAGSLRATLERAVAASGIDRARLHLLDGRSHDALEAADAVLVAAGTATLEAMLFARPMVIAYRVPRLTETMTLRRALIPYVGLPNVLAGRYVAPEFLQDAVTAPALARAVAPLLEAGPAARTMTAAFAGLGESLRCDTPSLVAEAVCDELARARSRRLVAP